MCYNSPMEKSCTRCAGIKPLEEFTKDRSQKDGLSKWCKKCKSISDKRYKCHSGGGKKSDDVVNEIERELFRNGRKTAIPKNGKRGRKPLTEEQLKLVKKVENYNTRLGRYGITKEQHEQLLISQAYKCAICPKEITLSDHIDHCHLTSVVRGILCRNCNLGLGLFMDDISILESAIKYLKIPRDLERPS